ncbi:MAG: aminopeptidase [Planctomycetota bacterium]|nr:MAG: aminopeptidase [Planctomycetota bacterium]
MRKRLRDLGCNIGQLPTGLNNAITDVPGVMVGHKTIIEDDPEVIRTGVTIISPRGKNSWEDYCFGGLHVMNGHGEVTGISWLNESGMLCNPIAITNTFGVGAVHEAMQHYTKPGFGLPIVAETYDGYLNDRLNNHVKAIDVKDALANLKSGKIDEGNVGGGTGMICHGFKGGVGTSSRIVNCDEGEYTVGVLVQSNYGKREYLNINGIPVGQMLDGDVVPVPELIGNEKSSIVLIVATNAPMLPDHCRRLAQRASLAVGKCGGGDSNGSGDFSLAFSTYNHLPYDDKVHELKSIAHISINPFLVATIEVAEEAIVNALTMAETMVGFDNKKVHAIPLDRLEQILNKYNFEDA